MMEDITLEKASTIITNLNLVEKCEKFNKEFERFKEPKMRSIGHYYYEKFFGQKTGIFKDSVCKKLEIARVASTSEKKLYGNKLSAAVDAVISALKNSIYKSIDFAEKKLESTKEDLEKLGHSEVDENKRKLLEIERKLYFNRFNCLEPLTKVKYSEDADFLNTLKQVVVNALLANDVQFRTSLNDGIVVLGHCIALQKLVKKNKLQLNKGESNE